MVTKPASFYKRMQMAEFETFFRHSFLQILTPFAEINVAKIDVAQINAALINQNN